MLRSLFSGISGLRAHQQMMDVTGNNIANVNTTGYKSSQTGVVTKTKLNGDSEPTLVVGNMDVQLSKVTEVQQTSDSDIKKEA